MPQDRVRQLIEEHLSSNGDNSSEKERQKSARSELSSEENFFKRVAQDQRMVQGLQQKLQG